MWELFTHADYLRECAQSEIKVVVSSMSQLCLIRNSLFYDKRDKGSHGRALRIDLPDFSLAARDRLEPSPELRDVGQLDNVLESGLPITLTFWRVVGSGRLKHRNPFFDATIGVHLQILCVDELHAINLGSLTKFCQELIWHMFLSSVWHDVGKAALAQWLGTAVIKMRAELTLWEDRTASANPLHKTTRVQKLTAGHFGVPSQRYL